jgi:hypothetical protein
MRTKVAGAVMFVVVVVFVVALSFSRAADFQPSRGEEFCGMYRIVSSNDPVFPMVAQQEWFLDFGGGIRPGRFSGSVAVSLRRNPNVKVRLMAWQYFPENGHIVLGNPFVEGDGKALARGAWELRIEGEGVIFKRGSYRVTLQRTEATGD